MPVYSSLVRSSPIDRLIDRRVEVCVRGQAGAGGIQSYNMLVNPRKVDVID